MISVYITSYNKSQFISVAINSVLNQTLMPSEIVIVDDFSTDNSKEIIHNYALKFPKLIKVVYNNKNYGIAKTRNIALDHCNNNIITFLDADDFFYKNKLKSEYELLKKYPDVHAVYSNFEYISENGEVLSSFANDGDSPAQGDIFINTFMRNYNVSSYNNYIYEMFYKDCAINIGSYNDKLRGWEDWDFRIRYSKKYKYMFCPQINSVYRKLNSGLHKSSDYDHYKFQSQVYKKNKYLIKDLIQEKQIQIKNRMYSKIVHHFRKIVTEPAVNIYRLKHIFYCIHFVLIFKNRKSFFESLRIIRQIF